MFIARDEKYLVEKRMAEREPKLETHEDGVNLVKAVFEQMGGKILADFEQKGELEPREIMEEMGRVEQLIDGFEREVFL